MNNRPIYLAAMLLVIVGAVNWGLVGLLGFDLVAGIFGQMSVLSRVVYSLVGMAAVYVAAAMTLESNN